MHRLFTISGDASRATPTWVPNQRRAIRAKNRFWRAPMRREAGGHENFFIAKFRDSESTQPAFRRSPRDAMMSEASRSSNASFAKTPAAQALPATLTNIRVAFWRITRIVASMHRCVAGHRALRLLIHARQHFLKQDSVFFDVLVYSGCCAFRFPSARSNKAISLH
jgi:hypothetical protein